MPISFVKKPAKAQIVVENNSGGKVVDTQAYEEQVDKESVIIQGSEFIPYADVGLDVSTTINTGNYNSTRIGVNLKIMCKLPEIDDVYEYIEGWVNAKMEALTSDIEPGTN